MIRIWIMWSQRLKYVIYRIHVLWNNFKVQTCRNSSGFTIPKVGSQFVLPLYGKLSFDKAAWWPVHHHTHTHSSIKVIVKLSTDLCMYKCCSRLALFPGPVRKIGKKLGLGLGLASSPGPAQFFGWGLGMKLAVGSVHYLYRLLLGGS